MLTLFTHPGEHSLPSSIGLLLLRAGFGLSMAFAHGYAKLTGFGEKAAQFPDPLGVGSTLSLGLVVGSEFFCALLIVLGLFTRWACLPLIVTMGVAAFMIHGADPYATKELAFVYLFAFSAILFTGAGRLSADHLLADRS